MKAIDFKTVPIGTLMKYSRFSIENNKSSPDIIGILCEKTFYKNKEGNEICWPVIHWEGRECGITCHPINAAPFREMEVGTIDAPDTYLGLC